MRKEKVIVHLKGIILVGCVLVHDEGARITDYLNHEHQFIAMTDVKVLDKDGTITKEEDYVCVNKNQIIFVKTEGE